MSVNFCILFFLRYRVGSFARGGSRTGGRQLDGTTEKEEEDDDDELELLKKMGLPSAFGKVSCL